MRMLDFIKAARQRLFNMDQAKHVRRESKYRAGILEDVLSKAAKVEYDPNRYCLRATRTTEGRAPNSAGE